MMRPRLAPILMLPVRLAFPVSAQPHGSMWYFAQAYRNDQHGKLLLMAPGYDRSAAVGFRCVADAE